MKQAFGIFALLLAMGAPAAAQMTPGGGAGMDSMQYYVGTWNCMAGPVGQTASKATATYTLNSGLLNETVDVPPSGKMKTAYVGSAATTYDAKNHRYVETWMGNDNGWSVSYAKPWMMTSPVTEAWADHANSTGTLSRTTVVRTDQNHFAFSGYPSIMSTKANFKGSCTRA
ncbi:MAG TPA: hypothetical protein VGX91_11710 [Candidatus Cybelea sp.]|nr:hypothetical protein [Candidatus Cybelea sp.]